MAPVLLLIHAAALAATLGLPSGEPSSAWNTPARLAGFSIALPSQAADVICVAGPEGWMIRVEGLDGSIRTERVSAPSDGRSREDLAWLASSLLSEVEARAGGARPTLPALVVTEPPIPPPKPRPAMAPRTPPPPRPPVRPPPPSPSQPEPLEIPRPPMLATAPLPEPEPLPAPPPAHLRPDLYPWVEFSPGYARRAGLTSAATLSLRGGVAARGWMAGVGLQLPNTREVLGTEGSLRCLNLSGRAAWSADHRLAPQLGVELGISRGEWSESGEGLHARTVPIAAVDAGLGLRLSPAWRLTAGAGLGAELAQTRIQIGDSQPVTLTPWQVDLVVALRWQIP